MTAKAKASESTETKSTKTKTTVDYSKPEHTLNIAKDGFYVPVKTWKYLVRHLLKGKNVMITGPSGTGKTEILERFANKYGMNFAIYDMGATHDPISAMLGVHRLSKEKGSYFDEAQFIKDIQKPGLIVLDEINRAPLNSNNILFPLLDQRRFVDLSIASSELDRKIHVHPECVFAATANIGAEFTGTNTLDTAFKNRFLFTNMGYPPQDAERKLLQQRTGVTVKDSGLIVKLAANIRKQKVDGALTETISIRQNLEIAEMVHDGFDLMETWEALLKPFFGDEYSNVEDVIQSL